VEALAEAGVAEVVPAEAGVAEAVPAEAGVAEVVPAEAGVAEAVPAEALAEAGVAEAVAPAAAGQTAAEVPVTLVTGAKALLRMTAQLGAVDVVDAEGAIRESGAVSVGAVL
jgi:hypothetical protein